MSLVTPLNLKKKRVRESLTPTPKMDTPSVRGLVRTSSRTLMQEPIIQPHLLNVHLASIPTKRPQLKMDIKLVNLTSGHNRKDADIYCFYMLHHKSVIPPFR